MHLGMRRPRYPSPVQSLTVRIRAEATIAKHLVQDPRLRRHDRWSAREVSDASTAGPALAILSV